MTLLMILFYHDLEPVVEDSDRRHSKAATANSTAEGANDQLHDVDEVSIKKSFWTFVYSGKKMRICCYSQGRRLDMRTG